MATKKRVLITIPAPAYRVLEQMAAQEERTPDQQAAYIVKCAVQNQVATPARTDS